MHLGASGSMARVTRSKGTKHLHCSDPREDNGIILHLRPMEKVHRFCGLGCAFAGNVYCVDSVVCPGVDAGYSGLPQIALTRILLSFGPIALSSPWPFSFAGWRGGC